MINYKKKIHKYINKKRNLNNNQKYRNLKMMIYKSNKERV